MKNMEAGLPYDHIKGGKGDGFEMLCYLILIAEDKNHIPHGNHKDGLTDCGVDIWVEGENGLTVYQCKNREGDISNVFKDAVNEFKEKWIDKYKMKIPYKYVLCCPAIEDSIKNTASFQAAEDKLKSINVKEVVYWDRNLLHTILKKHPDIVAEMFSDDIAVRHCGADWLRDVFIPLGEDNSKVMDKYFALNKKEHIYIPEEQKEMLLEKLTSKSKILIKGLPGSGKTILALDLARKFSYEGLEYFTYYVDLKSVQSAEKIVEGIKKRLSLPTVFILDNCQEDLDLVNSLNLRIDSLIKEKRAFVIYLARTIPVEEGIKTGEDKRFISFFGKSVITLKTNTDVFRNIIKKINPGLDIVSNDRADRIYSLAGGDLYILEHILQSINAASDIDNIEIDDIYDKVFENYFYRDTGDFDSILKIASLAQFDLSIATSYYNEAEKNGSVYEKKLLKDFTIEAGSPVKRYFLHSSLAELLCGSLIHANGKNPVKVTVNRLVEYLSYMVNDEDDTEKRKREIEKNLSKILYNVLKLSQETSDEIKKRFLSNENAYKFISRNSDCIFPNMWVKISKVLASEDCWAKYYDILKNNIINAEVIDKIITLESSKNSAFIYWLKNHPELSVILKKQLFEKMKTIPDKCEFYNLIHLVAGFYNRGDKAMWFEFIESIKNDKIIDMIEKTKAGKVSIGTFPRALRTIKDSDGGEELLAKLENKIGTGNYLELIKSNGSFVILAKILGNSTKEMTENIISALTPEYILKLLENAKKNASIGTLGINLRNIKSLERILLKKLENNIRAEDYLNLIENNGNFVDLIRIINNTTEEMAKNIVSCLNFKYIDNLVQKTMVKNTSIGALGITLRDIRKTNMKLFQELENKIGIENFLKIILINGNLCFLIKIYKELSDTTKIKLVQSFNNLSGDEIIDFISKSTFKDLCYSAQIAGRLNFFKIEYLHKNNRIFKKLICNSNWKDMAKGVKYLVNSRKKQIFSYFSNLIESYIYSLDQKNLTFETYKEKACFLSVLSTLKNTRVAVSENILKDITLPEFQKELLESRDFLRIFKMILFSLSSNNIDSSIIEKVLDIANSDEAVKHMENAAFPSVIWYLWNFYSLWFSTDTGSFNRYINKNMVNGVMEKLKNMDPENINTVLESTMLTGLLFYLNIEIDINILENLRNKIDSKHKRIQLLDISNNGNTSLPIFFSLTGFEYLCNSKLGSDDWKRLLPISDNYSVRTKALDILIAEANDKKKDCHIL